MSILKLGTYNLPDAEVVLVKTLFRLFSHGQSFRWTFVNAPPYDALLVDGTTPEGASGDVSRLAPSVLRLTRMNAGSEPNTLERPIRADKLQNWLAANERKLLSARQASTPSGDSQGVGFSDFSQEQQKSELPSFARFKLNRWPSALLLRRDPNRIRMATLLSRRALNAEELSVICQQPIGTCEVFIQVLRAANLIDVQFEDILTQPGPTPASGRSARPAQKSTFTRDLISSFRRRLGL